MSNLMSKVLVLSLYAGLTAISATCLSQEAQVEVNQSKAAGNMVHSQYVGHIVGNRDIRVSSEIDARVTMIAQVGDRVGKGAQLVKLDDSLYRIQINQHKAQQALIEAQLKYARKRLADLKTLTAKNAASENEMLALQRDVQVYEAEYELSLQRRQETERLLELSSITAPFDGIVAERFSTVDEFIEQGDPLLRFVNVDDIEISVQVPVNIGYTLGAETRVDIETPYSTTTGVVRSIVPVSNTSSYTQELRITPESGQYVIGDNVVVKLRQPILSHAISINRDALLYKETGIYVAQVTSDSTVKIHKVDILGNLGGWVNITGPVSVGESIVVRGGEQLKDGQKVKIVTGK